MISWCMENSKGFGICSLINEEISLIGTYVKVHSVLKHYENGELDIIVKGSVRIIVKDISIHPDGYHLGLVDDYSDLITSVDENAASELKNSFLKLIKLVDFKLDDKFWNSFERRKLKSFKLAEKSGLNLEQQQELITLTDENSRISYLINHLDRMNREIKLKSALKKIISADGYLN